MVCVFTSARAGGRRWLMAPFSFTSKTLNFNIFSDYKHRVRRREVVQKSKSKKDVNLLEYSKSVYVLNINLDPDVSAY